jgi:hypothetical protein
MRPYLYGFREQGLIVKRKELPMLVVQEILQFEIRDCGDPRRNWGFYSHGKVY